MSDSALTERKSMEDANGSANLRNELADFADLIECVSLAIWPLVGRMVWEDDPEGMPATWQEAVSEDFGAVTATRALARTAIQAIGDAPGGASDIHRAAFAAAIDAALTKEN